eukprot:TRINITY_DN1264_c0_g3_i1.p1 TRINITY_DN1264_c0_g3~~TRINITY_DN1264_c0_g3_i1.p1  ORF type:complete len:622 (+),score=232.38 TRINITY_DN1264_c0_g3_i1:100-1866(+)
MAKTKTVAIVVAMVFSMVVTMAAASSKVRASDPWVARVSPFNAATALPKFNGTLHYNAQFWFLLNQYFDGLPHSYFVPDTFWRSEKYLPTHLHSNPIDGQEAIEDRVCTHFGLNLYDAATWEIALGLQGEFEIPNAYENSVLYASSTGTDNTVGGLADIRSDTSQYLYGRSQIPGSSLQRVTMPGNQTNPIDGSHTIAGAFFFRMISAYYVTEDPLIGSYARSFRSPYPFTGGPAWNTFGVIIWNDWKPITGENVWGAIIGPIQSLYLQNNGSIPSWSNFATAPNQVQLSLSVLPALMALQSVEGSLYHCPSGSQLWPPDENEGQNVSNENNFSGYAAITMLYQLLNNNTNTSNSDLAPAMQDLLSLQQGLQSWFIKYSLAPPLNNSLGARVFYQGGHVNFTGGYYPVSIYSDGGFAVDCQTWGSAVLGANFIDNSIAKKLGTAFNMWQQTKNFSAYYAADGSLAGVGYTIHPLHDIWSGEWTWGAVLATRELSMQYSNMTNCPNCASWAQSLMADSTSMANNLRKTVAQGGLLSESGGFLYCNHRYFIPWGWWANPLPALCSTAWSVMDDHTFNPFVLGGGPLAKFY